MCCVFSLLTTSQSAPSAWLRSTETKVTWRRKKRNPTEVRKEAQAINPCLCCETCWTPSYSSQWMEMRSRLTSLTAVWQRKRTTSGPIHPRLLRYQSSSRRSAAVTQCPVFVLIMLTAYWFFRIRRTDRHRCNPRSLQHPGQWCEAQSEFCMAVSPAVGSNLRAQGLLCNTTSRNLNSKLKEEYWLSAQISPPKV